MWALVAVEVLPESRSRHAEIAARLSDVADARGVFQHPFLPANIPLSFVHARPPDFWTPTVAQSVQRGRKLLHDAIAGRCCVNRNWPRALPRVGSSPIDRARLWSTKLGHSIEHVARKHRFEPYRDRRRPNSLNQATAACSEYCASNSAGGMSPSGPNSRRVLNQSTHVKVANSTASRVRHGPFRRITSVLYTPITDSARVLSS